MCVFSPRISTFAAALCAIALSATLGAQQETVPSPVTPPQMPTAVPTGSLGLEQILDLVEGRSEQVAIARAAIARAEADRIRARSGLYPQLSASGSYERALAAVVTNFREQLGLNTV